MAVCFVSYKTRTKSLQANILRYYSVECIECQNGSQMGNLMCWTWSPKLLWLDFLGYTLHMMFMWPFRPSKDRVVVGCGKRQWFSLCGWSPSCCTIHSLTCRVSAISNVVKACNMLRARRWQITRCARASRDNSMTTMITTKRACEVSFVRAMNNNMVHIHNKGVVSHGSSLW